MPYPVPEMIRKRPRDAKLHRPLRDGAKAAEPLRHGARLEVPSQQRGDQVCRGEDVDAAREHTAGDAVEGGPVPGYLGFVDGQVGRNGAVQALGGEDGVGVGWLCRLCLGVGFRGGGLESDMPEKDRVSCIGSGVPTGLRAQGYGPAYDMRKKSFFPP